MLPQLPAFSACRRRWRCSRASSGVVDALRPVDPPSHAGDGEDPAVHFGVAEPHRVGGSELPREEPEPVRVTHADDGVGGLAEPALDTDPPVVHLDPPGASALADQLVGDGEAVAPRPLRLDRIRQRAEDQIRLDRDAETRQVARPRIGGEVAQGERLATAPAELDATAGESTDRAASGGDRGEGFRVGRDGEGLTIQVGAFSGLGDLGPVAERVNGPGAQPLELEAVAESGRQARGRCRERVDDEAGGQLGFRLGHSPECLRRRPV